MTTPLTHSKVSAQYDYGAVGALAGFCIFRLPISCVRSVVALSGWVFFLFFWLLRGGGVADFHPVFLPCMSCISLCFPFPVMRTITNRSTNTPPG